MLPGSTTFYMGSGDDWRDQKAKADAQAARATMLKTYVDAGALSPLQMLNAAVDAGDLDAAFLPEDATSAGAVDDNDKLVAGESQAERPVTTPLPSSTPQAQSGAPPPGLATKAARRATIDDEWGWAVKWAEDASQP